MEHMYKTITIIGVGLIGGSFGLAVHRKYPDSHIIGVSSRAAVTSALEMGAIHEGCGYEEVETAVADADLVVLCTPIHRIQGLLSVIAGSLKPGALVTEVGSTKREIGEHAAEVIPGSAYFIGGHPMAGSERSGVNAADPFLFQNAIYVLCPAENVPEEILSTFSDFIHCIGAKVIVLEAALHDRIAAAVSHLPQILAVSLVKMVSSLHNDDSPCLTLAAGGFRDMTRIASSPFAMWDDIFRTNRDAVCEMIDIFMDNLSDLRDRVGSSDLGVDFEIANMTRGKIPRDTKGFMKTLFEVLVVVEDKPGVIAEISSELAEKGINIKDIEVLKVREGEGGTLRLAFDREEQAEEAIVILNGLDYLARLRS